MDDLRVEPDAIMGSFGYEGHFCWGDTQKTQVSQAVIVLITNMVTGSPSSKELTNLGVKCSGDSYAFELVLWHS